MSLVIERRVAFNGGEFSPWTDPRTDLAKYQSACRRLVNFRPTVYGGAFRRAGTVFMGQAHSQETASRLVEFEFSVTTTLVLEFGHLAARFWTTGPAAGRVLTSGSAIYTLATPWSAEEIFELQFAQQNDVVYVTHPDHAPRRLSRMANNSWTIAEMPQEWPPALDAPLTGITISAAVITAGTGRTLSASSPLFVAGHVGSHWIIRHRRDDPSVSIALTAPVAPHVSSVSDPLFVLGAWTCNVAVNTGGTWEKNAVVQRSYNKTTWETIRSISSSGVTSGTISGNELDPCWLRVQMISTSGSPPSSGSFNLQAEDPDHYGIVKITGWTSTTSVTATISFELGGTAATKYWEEGAWSGARGFPRAVTFHENRLIFGGTASRPQTVWGSVIDDYHNFRTGSDDDMGLAFTLASDAANGVQWLVSQKSLVIGTTGSEWVLGARSNETTLTPTNAAARRNTNYGSAFIQARAVNDATLFVQRSGRKVREFVYTYESDGFAAQDLTLLAEHVTEGGITQMAVQKNPETIVWFVTGSGDIIGLTYERGQNVAGWFRYRTDGAYESIAVVSGAGEEDEIWVTVRRVADGAPARYVERFQPDILRKLKDGRRDELIYADCAYLLDPSPPVPAEAVEGLDHLEGRTVSILADGSPHPPLVVLGGVVTLQYPATRVVVGLPYESVLEPTYLETNDPASLSKAGRKRLTRADAAVWKSLGMEVSANGGATWSAVEFRSPADAMDEAPPLFTGLKTEFLDATSEREASVMIRQAQPLPLNLMSLHLHYDLNLL